MTCCSLIPNHKVVIQFTFPNPSTWEWISYYPEILLPKRSWSESFRLKPFPEPSNNDCSRNGKERDGECLGKATKPAAELFDKVFVPTSPLVAIVACFLVPQSFAWLFWNSYGHTLFPPCLKIGPDGQPYWGIPAFSGALPIEGPKSRNFYSVQMSHGAGLSLLCLVLRGRLPTLSTYWAKDLKETRNQVISSS